MTSRKRLIPSAFQSRSNRRAEKNGASSKKRRQHLLETLESRQLLAGPQLIGIQPNDGDLIVDGSIRDTAPRVLTFRFDQDQSIDPNTFDAIRITRAGNDGTFGTGDDVLINPGLVTLGDNATNEVVVRFADALPDDRYRAEVFGFDDANLGIVGLRNDEGDLLQPSSGRVSVTNFELRLGALIEAVVPQPVIRNADGSLSQNRNEIVVYFNEDPLFVEDESASGVIQIGGQQITVLATQFTRSFDTTRIVFAPANGASATAAVYDPANDTITVSFVANTTFNGIVAAIDNLPEFSASMTAGNGAVVFAPPSNPSVRFEVKGQPSLRSAENPRFYQLLLTQDTVRTTDDVLYFPSEVVYDPATFTARLFFAGDINNLPGVPASGGTFRLRVGTAVDNRVDLILPPQNVAVAPSASSDFGVDGLRVTFTSRAIGENASGRQVRFINTGNAGLSVALDGVGNVVYNFGGTNPTVGGLQSITASTPAVDALITVTSQLNGMSGGLTEVVPSRVVGSAPLTLSAVGDTLGTALDVGVFGNSGLTSLIFSEAIDPQPFLIELPGGNNDPGRLQIPETAGNGLLQFINSDFGINGADDTDGITEISYNFNGVFATGAGGQSFLNQINERQKDRIREALGLWSRSIGVQFRETVSDGITFALGDTTRLTPVAGTRLVNFGVLNANLRIDPTFNDSAIVFSNQTNFNTAFGEDFLRKATAGVGLLLGLEQASGLTEQTLLSLSPAFLNATINPGQAALTGNEPSFPGNFDVLHGQHLHRPDSVDVDLYRFVIDLEDADRVGTLTVETFAERLADSSSLDTDLQLFQEFGASATTDFGIGNALSVRFDSTAAGKLGNNTTIQFLRSDRVGGDSQIRITAQLDDQGNPIPNGIVVDIPRPNGVITSVPVGSIVDAINNDPRASSLVRASIAVGSATTNVATSDLPLATASLRGGGLVQVSRNDDYFSEDSRIIATLGSGVYYIGVAASGNDTYDPTIPGSGFGGLTQGAYDLHVKFEPQVDETEIIRDLDNPRVGVPGTPLDGDGDGTPGGVHNFWFQTRPENRQLIFNTDGRGLTAGQTIRIVGAGGAVRTYEFVANGGSARPGNTAVPYSTGVSGPPTPAGLLASALAQAIRGQIGATGVTVTQVGSRLELFGERLIETSSNFRGADVLGRNIFVDKTAGPNADGSLNAPFNNIANAAVANAFGSALAGDIVRIVGNGGQDGNVATEADNFSYQIGVSATGGVTLEDGRNLEVPRGVTTVIDSGAVLKFRSSRIGVGSSTLLEDRSGGVLQVLGTPRLVQFSPTGAVVTQTVLGDENANLSGFSDGSVVFTSINDIGADSSTTTVGRLPAPGDWGGLVYRRDLDRSEGRFDLEDEGIFLQTVNHAQIRYGGGSNVLIDSIQQLVNPIQIFELRPTITFNEISFSADAAISASPDSFEETSFQSPKFQQADPFTADYSRVGPAIYDNLLVENSINGLFVRVATTSSASPRSLSVAGRFDDTDIVHYFPENLLVTGTPGGSIQDGVSPDLSSTAVGAVPGGTLVAGTYDYRLTFLDANGFESLASDVSAPVTVPNASSIQLLNLQPVPTNLDYIARRLYRLDPTNGDYFLVATLDANSGSFLDTGSVTPGMLDLGRAGIRGRLDASLVIDPGTVLKFRGTRLELGQGTQLLAEGTNSEPIIFTSFADDRFGSGGTFDTNNDNGSATGEILPARGDWSGIYAAPTSFVSLDFATVAYGGGVSLLTGGQSRGFAPLELQQAEGRITNGRFEFNEDGQDGAGPVGRFGLLGITPSTIFVRDSQPVIVANTFIDNRGSIIDIDSDSLTAERLVDVGRQTGAVERFESLDDNYGPLIRLNRYDNVPAVGVANRQITGLEIRGGVLSTESVFDDTDIVHLLFDTIEVGNLHSSGGLRLLSRSDESLVVKFAGPGNGFSDTLGTGLSATGTRTGVIDRIGGSIQIVGLPGSPVVLTSFQDDSVGAGLRPDGSQFTDSNGDGFGSRPDGNDWRGILLDQFSNDRNVDFILERTISAESAPGLNGTVANAQVLGAIAPNILSGDDQLRLGFEVEGFLATDNDVDTYSFTAEAGTRIWVDIDRTSFTLDSVIEVLDANGNVLARSDNSFAEVAGEPLQDIDASIAATVGSLQGGADAFTEFGSGGLYTDFGSVNPRDAGLSLALPGNRGTRSVYFFRVRSASVNPGDQTGGLTSGGYRFQVRLQENQEFPGSVIRFADIRYANNGIHTRGLQGTSPLLGDAQEDEVIGGAAVSNNLIPVTGIGAANTTPNGQRPQFIGNLLLSRDQSLSVGGELGTSNDIDFYQVDVQNGLLAGAQVSSVFDIDYADGFSRPDTTLLVFYDSDGPSGPVQPVLVFVGEDSNVLDDQSQPVASAPIDLLTRGSVSTGDPLIGPVSLSQGTYYVGVVGAGVTAEALLSITARREPIESILRIFDDHVEEIGGSTAAPPVNGALFDATALNPGVIVTTDRANDPGHQRSSTFNGSRNNNLFPPSVQAELGGLNNTLATAQALETLQPLWSLANDPNIGDRNGNTSQFIPHTTVNGTTINEIVDIYSFTVAVDGSLVILDIDNGINPAIRDPESLPEDFPTLNDPSSVDLQLLVFDATGALVPGGTNRSSLASEGALGSVAQSSFSQTTADPFVQLTLPAGTYFVAVAPEATTFDADTGVFSLDPADRPNSGTYQLHVSVENHPASGVNPGNQSYRFDRSAPSAILTSNPFDLTGYGANDLPRFYFNYFFNPEIGDTVSVTVTSDQNPAGSTLAGVGLVSSQGENTWRQSISSLADFAGHTNIRVSFAYQSVDAFSIAEGLYLDDFIIGFAERGELVTNADFGVTSVIGTSSTQAGEYQLEVRPGTVYGSPIVGGLLLESTFDTNARQAEVATIVAPHVTQISDGDSFVLSDGVRNVRFEFELNTSPGITPGNIRVPYTATSTQSQIADAIRSAINLSGVRSTIQIQASDSTGSATGGFGDVQVAVSGLLLGDFLELSQPGDLPPSTDPLDPNGGPFRLPVVFNRGLGDSNVIRAQTQVIVESNRISDVRSIAIRSEPGTRDVNPRDRDANFFDRNPTGNGNPGAVRNLPTLNNEVVGGQAPGIVIRNNTIDQAGFAGIKVDGQLRPFIIDSNVFDLGTDDLTGAFRFGELISDGLLLVIDAGDTRVVFEFEDISGAATTAGGSGTPGGNGFADGHVPIYYRHNGNYLGRNDAPHTRQEVMLAIQGAINSSILVNNGLSAQVEATIGTSPFGFDSSFSELLGGAAAFNTILATDVVVYVQGATNVQFSFDQRNPPPNPALNPFVGVLAPIHESPQPVSRIVNNTIYGNDGTASRFAGNATAEPNELFSQAVDTRIGSGHSGAFIRNGQIGDNVGGAPALADVDMFRVELVVGDRLTVDIDTIAGGPNTTLRLFDSRGNVVATSLSDAAPDFLETAANPANFDSALPARAVDPFLDFTSTATGTYFIGVSASGNDTYDALSTSGRVAGVGPAGNYTIAIENFTPRSFVLSIDDGSNARFPAANTGTQASDLIGTTFTVTQIADLQTSVAAGNPTNALTFEFTAAGGGQRLANGNIRVPIRGSGDFRVPDLVQSIARAIAGTGLPISATAPNPPLPNHSFGNGPDGLSGPVGAVTAVALGSAAQGLVGLTTYDPVGDFTTPLGHDRPGNPTGSVGFAGTTTSGTGISELYVLVERAARIEISPEAAAAGLRLDPAPGLNIDQLLPETGVLLTGGSSSTIFNNVFANLHQGVVQEITRADGFSGVQPNVHPKPGITIVTANVFQHIETANNVFRIQATQPGPGNGSIGITPGPSNINGGTDDFNITLGNNAPLFVNPEGGNFLPTENSAIIDSGINSVTERDRLASLLLSVGLPVSNVLAPNFDVNGVLRADNPNVAPPGGLGSQVFNDRGSNELADFVGPVAIINVPLDNDAEGIDTSPATSFLRLSQGVFQEFRIQLRDTGDASDPFSGLGINDDSVVVPAIEGLRASGANVTVFEDERLLVEGIDYTFSYDETQNVITLTPLAGIWQNDRSYRIALNNQDRTVLVAPDSSQVSDGDQVSITDSNGATLVFEFESGYQLDVPEAITLIVPDVGTSAGGLSDGGLFRINDGVNPVVVFEFDTDGVTLPGSVPVPLPAGQTPTDSMELPAFLASIAEAMRAAIANPLVPNGALPLPLNVDVRVIGNRVVVGGERGTTANSIGSGLTQAARTLALSVPNVGASVNAAAGGIRDGDSFTVSDGVTTVTFEYTTNPAVTAGRQAITINANASADVVAAATRDAINNSALNITTSIVPGTRSVFLNLPLQGTASVAAGPLSVVGISRPAIDGSTITITPADGAALQTLEINRTDLRDPGGSLIPPTVTLSNIPINITRVTTADELAAQIANAIVALPPIAGLPTSDIQSIAGGTVSIGGQAGLGIAVTGTSLELSGTPSVTGASTIEVFGPLLVNLPASGGAGLADGSVLVLTDPVGNDVVIEFSNNQANQPNRPFADEIVPFDLFTTVDALATSLVAAINRSTAGIVATFAGNGRVSLGRIELGRVDINGIIDPTDNVTPIPGVNGATVSRGIVTDGERLTIRQGAIAVTYEFEAAVGGNGVTAGNVQVAFQAGSTVGNVAVALAAAINNNRNGLDVNAVAELDLNGVPTGRVNLNDRPGTIVEVAAAPTLNLIGVAGGATPILLSPAFSATEVKQSLIAAINSVNTPGQPAVTPLFAENRGGATFFVSGGASFNGPVQNFSLPAITDLAGNPLEPNRPDLSTQFTILMPTVGLDFGDAPDPVAGVPGRFPTLNVNNGARHVVGDQLFLGRFIDTDVDGSPSLAADGDDTLILGSSTGSLFATSVVNGELQITILASAVNPLTRDGDTITIDTGVSVATLEFDLNGRFDEDNFAITPTIPTSSSSIANAIVRAIAESPLAPASVTSRSITLADSVVVVSADDEDGVNFSSETNPNGILNRGVALPIDVTVTGAGILEAWIDFNGDGDFNDPGEQVIPMVENAGLDALRDQLCPVDLTGMASNIFADTGSATTRTFCIVVPPTAPIPTGPTQTFARFRVSREGGLAPTGLALSGEVEDYALTLLPGLPPVINTFNRTFVVNEDSPLQVLDGTGTLTPATTDDDGLLMGIVDPDGDNVAVFAGDVGPRQLFTTAGTLAGDLNLNADGTFTFNPAPDFAGVVSFDARVSDVPSLDPATALVNSRPISVTINVNPVNDPPIATSNDVIITRTIAEDTVTTFAASNTTVGGISLPGLIEGNFVAGPADEIGQPLIIQSVSSVRGPNLTALGGSVTISANGQTVTYTPPADYNGVIPDTFNYVVADVPGNGQISASATKLGTVTISFTAVNDAPRTGNDTFQGVEGQALLIPINGTPTAPGILDNDVAGPPDETAAGQVVTLVANQFPITTTGGGTVTREGNNLRYIPRPLFSGVDNFTYQVVDSLNALATGSVSIIVGGINNAPIFLGINGSAGVTSISRTESKTQTETSVFDLTTWFNDPESDPLTFTATSSNPNVAAVTLTGSTLTLAFPPFGFGSSTLTITATDGSGAGTSVAIPVTVINTEDPPRVISPNNVLIGIEDQIVTADLGGVFADPDNEPLTFSVARLGNVLNPTPAQIAAHPLVQRIDFVGNQLRITLDPDQSGAVEIEIAAADASFRVSATFALNVSNVPDAPIAAADRFNVPIGGRIQELNPVNGLLGNDRDADGNAMTIDMASIVGPSRGTLELNPDGTFVYVNTSGAVGETDSFTYRVVDSTGRFSNTATVTFALNQSRYQNPLAALSEDVNADGRISAIDALRIINFLARNLNGGSFVPVNSIAAPPPDFVDPNGDGRVSALDAVTVINRLAQLNNAESEFIAPSSVTTSSFAATSVTTGFATANLVGLPTRQVEIVDPTNDDGPIDAVEPRDLVLASGFEISSAASEQAVLAVGSESSKSTDADYVDEVLSSMWDDVAANQLDFD